MVRMKQIRWVLWLGVVMPLVALAAEQPDPETVQAAAHAQAVRMHAGSPRGVAWLYRLHESRDLVPDLNLLAQAYQDVLTRRTADPEVRRVARLLLADVERARGRLKKAAELMQPLGFVDRFHVVGAFDNEGKAGCDVDYGPETSIDLAASYPTRAGETTWRAIEQIRADGYVDLSNVVRPNSEAVAYALAVLESPTDARVELSVGTSGAFRMWLNGEKVAASDRYNQPRPDQSRVAVRLRKGVNRVLLKVCQESGPLGFYLRQDGAQGVLPKKPQPLPTVAELLEREVKRNPKDPDLRADYAVVLAATRAFDERTHQDTVEAERAAEAAPANASLQLLAAALHDEDHNLRRKYLVRALEAAPESPAARVAMAEHELSRDHPHKALTILEPLVKAQPSFTRAKFLLARTLAELDEGPRAVQVAEEAWLRATQVPAMVREAARLSRRLDRAQEAIDRYRVAVALRFDDENSRRALSSLLVDTGRPQDGAHELATLLKLDPFDNQARMRLGDLLVNNGEISEGLSRFADARRQTPDEPEVHEREGRALLRAGKRDEAILAFERSLQLRPQNPQLREALRAMQGQSGVPGLEYALDPSKLVKEADALTGEDLVYLVDYGYTRVQASGLSAKFRQLAVKVYTQRGVEGFRQFPISYSPNRQDVQVVKVRITKPDGSVVESYGESERNLNEPWSGMYYDARSRVLSFPSLAVGDVLEIQFRLEDTARENLLSDYWGDVEYVQATAPKIRFQYLIDMPASRPLYWNKSQLPEHVKSATNALADGRVLYRWDARNVSKVIPEPSMPGWAEVATTLHVSTYKSWDDVGRYYWGLVRDQLRPNDELRRSVDEALVGVDRKDELAVVRAIYNFVVTHTRYVALEFGIHGYKPYRVDRVLARRFGDCKDKASLIYAMLKVAGVDSRLVLLRMRNLGQLSEEPASLAAFNHAILYVPKFDLYLDGTAAFHGADELPTADRVANVLRVEPDGKSTYLTTPEAKPEDNATVQTMDVKLKPDGTAEVGGTSQVTGVQAPEYRRSYQAAATRKARFEQAWAGVFPGLSVSKLSLSDLKLNDAVKLDYGMSVPRYAEVLPNGLRFFTFGSGRSYTQVFAPLAERRYDVVMSNPWVNRLSVRYAIPEGYAIAGLPQAIDDDTPFGRLTMSCRAEGNATAVCDSELTFKVARVKAADYPAFRAFLGRVDQAYSRKLVVTQAAPTSTTAHR